VSAFFSFGGWWERARLPVKVRNPRRNLPLGLHRGACWLVTAVYLLVSFAFLSVVPLQRIASNHRFVAQFRRSLFGSVGGENSLWAASCMVRYL